MEKRKIVAKVNLKIDLLDEFNHLLLDEVIKYISDIKTELEAQGWSALRFELDQYYEYDGLNIFGERIETDAEFKERLKLEEKEKEILRKREAKEYEKYLQLKEKFENG